MLTHAGALLLGAVANPQWYNPSNTVTLCRDTLDTTQDGHITRGTFIANAKMILFNQDPAGVAGGDGLIDGDAAGAADAGEGGREARSPRGRFAAARSPGGANRPRSGVADPFAAFDAAAATRTAGKKDSSTKRSGKKVRKTSLSESRVFHLQELFTAADPEGLGSIGQADFAFLVQDEAVAGGAKLSAPFVSELFKSIDTDQDGHVDFDEVVAAFEAVDGVTGKTDNPGDGAKISVRVGHRTEAAEAMADRLGHEVEEQRVARASESATSRRNQRQLEEYFEDSQADYEHKIERMEGRERDLHAKVKALERELSESGKCACNQWDGNSFIFLAGICSKALTAGLRTVCISRAATRLLLLQMTMHPICVTARHRSLLITLSADLGVRFVDDVTPFKRHP